MRWVVGLASVALATGCRIDETLGREFPGPACDCHSYFPMCVGARWTYTVTDPANGSDLGVKDMRIVRFEEHSDEAELAGFHDLFVQQRLTPLDRKLSWLVREDQRLIWLMDAWYTLEGTLQVEKRFEPGKTRLDESRTTDGETWMESYVEIKTTYGDSPTTTTLTHMVTWTVSHQTTPDGAWIDALCHQKLDRTVEAGGSLANSTYCFERGVGKVYELTVNESDERLLDFTIPGCE